MEYVWIMSKTISFVMNIRTSLSGQHFGACPLLFFKFTPGERIRSLEAAALSFLFFAKKFTIKVKFVKLRGCFGEVTALDFYPHF